MKILIIDDERSIRNSLKEILVDEGYDVDVAENGAQGVHSYFIIATHLTLYGHNCSVGVSNTLTLSNLTYHSFACL